MQAVDKQVTTVTSQRFIRVMAGFGMIVAALLIVVVVISGAVLFAGSVASQPATKATATDALGRCQVSPLSVRANTQSRARRTGAPLAAPGLAAVRASEHAVTSPWTGDPLAAPGLAAFRASEHAEAH